MDRTNYRLITKLQETFGDDLDKLSREQKIRLRLALTYLIWGREDSNEIFLEDCWDELLGSNWSVSRDMKRALKILGNIDTDEAEELLVLLQVQCRKESAMSAIPDS